MRKIPPAQSKMRHHSRRRPKTRRRITTRKKPLQTIRKKTIKKLSQNKRKNVRRKRTSHIRRKKRSRLRGGEPEKIPFRRLDCKGLLDKIKSFEGDMNGRWDQMIDKTVNDKCIITEDGENFKQKNLRWQLDNFLAKLVKNENTAKNGLRQWETTPPGAVWFKKFLRFAWLEEKKEALTPGRNFITSSGKIAASLAGPFGMPIMNLVLAADRQLTKHKEDAETDTIRRSILNPIEGGDKRRKIAYDLLVTFMSASISKIYEQTKNDPARTNPGSELSETEKAEAANKFRKELNSYIQIYNDTNNIYDNDAEDYNTPTGIKAFLKTQKEGIGDDGITRAAGKSEVKKKLKKGIIGAVSGAIGGAVGGALLTSPPMATGVPITTPTSKPPMVVTVPPGVSQGQMIQINAGGQMLNVQVPAGMVEGQQFQVMAPAPVQAAVTEVPRTITSKPEEPQPSGWIARRRQKKTKNKIAKGMARAVKRAEKLASSADEEHKYYASQDKLKELSSNDLSHFDLIRSWRYVVDRCPKASKAVKRLEERVRRDWDNIIDNLIICSPHMRSEALALKWVTDMQISARLATIQEAVLLLDPAQASLPETPIGVPPTGDAPTTRVTVEVDDISATAQTAPATPKTAQATSSTTQHPTILNVDDFLKTLSIEEGTLNPAEEKRILEILNKAKNR
jgi:hypothetical protein